MCLFQSFCILFGVLCSVQADTSAARLEQEGREAIKAEHKAKVEGENVKRSFDWLFGGNRNLFLQDEKNAAEDQQIATNDFRAAYAEEHHVVPPQSKENRKEANTDGSQQIIFVSAVFIALTALAFFRWKSIQDAEKANDDLASKLLSPAEPQGIQPEFSKIEQQSLKVEAAIPKTRISTTFSVACETAWGDEIRVVGSAVKLGQWDPSKAATMRCTDGNKWVTKVDVEFPAAKPLEYKYVLMSKGEPKSWEPCENRVLYRPPINTPLVCHDVWGSN
jgi:hypothetical protein